MEEQMTQQTLIAIGQSNASASRATRRMNMYLPEEMYLDIERMGMEKGLRPSELVQNALRLMVLAYKHSANPEQGLYWRDGDQYSKVLLEVRPSL